MEKEKEKEKGMGEESEKRFHQVMDKLFQIPPKSKPSRTTSSALGVQLSRGKKRPAMSSALALVDPKSREMNTVAVNGKTPLCRPWDRGDLFARIATFKSMTWFAKPQVINAVNCARRGWINVDMDTLACEACRSRLLFSTPASWTQQQVDKAALVFSLKLDSGHKLLCPWIDNICDEKLAEFPPAATVVLVDQYRIRYSVLSRLAALPVISPKAIDCLRSPQLEQFVRETLTVERDEFMETPQKEDVGNEPTSVSSLTYYQAQKLISLCGWELRRLPYLVDSKDQLDQSSKVAYPADKSLLSGKNHTITVDSSCTDKSLERNPDDDSQAPDEVIFNPNSVVLECRLCGACIGLWNFSMVPRLMEFLRVSGYTEVNGDHVSHTDCGKSLLSGNSDHDKSRASRVNAATSGSTMLDRRPANFNLTIAGGPSPTNNNYKAKIALPIIGRNLRAWLISESVLSDDLVAKSSSGACKNPDMLLAGASDAEGTSLSEAEVVREAQLENGQNATQVSGNIEMEDNVESVDKVDPGAKDHCQSKVSNDVGSTGEDCDTSHVGESDENSRMIVEGNNSTQGGEQGTGSDIIVAGVHPLIHNIIPSPGKDLQDLPLDKAMEFDPFKLHRHFCPWIASSAGSQPGWIQTLSALERHKEFSSPLSISVPSSSLIKVDDPVASVKKLFTSPPAKRKKLVRPS